MSHRLVESHNNSKGLSSGTFADILLVRFRRFEAAMGLRLLRSAALLICLWAILVCGAALAQDRRAPNLHQPKLTLEQLREVGERYGVPPASRFFARLGAALPGRSNIFDDTAQSAKPPPQTVIKHLRSTKGIPFPPPEQQAGPRPSKEYFTKGVDKAIRMRAEKMNEAMKKTLVPHDLPDCRAAKTETRSAKTKNDQEKIFFDMLFIRKEMIPLNADEVFGKKTLIRSFRLDKATPSTLSAIGLNVPCLPYRMRVTNAGVFKHQGIDALKNYDSGPSGPGVLSDVMQQIAARR